MSKYQSVNLLMHFTKTYWFHEMLNRQHSICEAFYLSCFSFFFVVGLTVFHSIFDFIWLSSSSLRFILLWLCISFDISLNVSWCITCRFQCEGFAKKKTAFSLQFEYLFWSENWNAFFCSSKSNGIFGLLLLRIRHTQIYVFAGSFISLILHKKIAFVRFNQPSRMYQSSAEKRKKKREIRFNKLLISQRNLHAITMTTRKKKSRFFLYFWRNVLISPTFHIL